MFEDEFIEFFTFVKAFNFYFIFCFSQSQFSFNKIILISKSEFSTGYGAEISNLFGAVATSLLGKMFCAQRLLFLLPALTTGVPTKMRSIHAKLVLFIIIQICI